jgi:hypothetical protein
MRHMVIQSTPRGIKERKREKCQGDFGREREWVRPNTNEGKKFMNERKIGTAGKRKKGGRCGMDKNEKGPFVLRSPIASQINKLSFSSQPLGIFLPSINPFPSQPAPSHPSKSVSAMHSSVQCTLPRQDQTSNDSNSPWRSNLPYHALMS